MQLKPINQQVVAIFGASSGIGRETALELTMWLETHPAAKWSILAALGGAAITLLPSAF